MGLERLLRPLLGPGLRLQVLEPFLRPLLHLLEERLFLLPLPFLGPGLRRQDLVPFLRPLLHLRVAIFFIRKKK